ncbi:hypothetical protein, partial [Frisingicoccus sp.]|uniref:hypothetical protein n=1 Tax=Frisingicoccus sp. TaxID=1918627 RepID=UPI00386F9886
NDVNVNRQHKDRLFRFIFQEKSALLSLYNAINRSDYTDPESLEIYTMENYVYMGMKNDVSFLIDWNMNVFEHQSTYNPNMPLRGFLYMSAMFKKFIKLNRLDIYGSKEIKLPIPRYYVFYNGTRKLEDEVILALTDSMPFENAKEISCAEFRAHLVNINDGHNPKMMERCPLLREYAIFVEDIRNNMALGMEHRDAIVQATDVCINKGGLLSDILQGHKAEVTDMLLTEYDEAFHIASEKEISREEGRQEEKAKTEREKQRADAAEKLARESELRAAVFALKLKGKTEEEIAEIREISIDKVHKILSEI